MLHLRHGGAGTVEVRGTPSVALGSYAPDVPSSLADCGPGARWNWDGDRLLAETDRLGMFPLYYQVSDAAVAVGPDVESVIGAIGEPTLDPVALAVLLRAGFLVGNDTPFQAVHVLPPGGRLEWCPGRWSVSGNMPTAATYDGTFDAAVAEYAERFQGTVARIAAGVVDRVSTVPLSGGRDSRHIVFALCANGTPPREVVTIGGEGGYSQSDVVAARALAQRLGLEHTTLRLPESNWDAHRRVVRASSYATAEHWWFAPLVEHLRGRRDAQMRPVLYEGVAGDVLSTPFLKTPHRQRLMERQDLPALADDLLGPEGWLPRMLPADVYAAASRAVARDRLVDELQVHVDRPNPLAWFFFFNRTRRVTAIPPARLFGQDAAVMCPYLAPAVWDFLASLPPHLVQAERTESLHDAAIRITLPEAADVPYATKRYLTSPRLRYERRTVREMLRTLAVHRPALVRPTFALPRLIRAAVQPSYLLDATPLAAPFAYLLELDRQLR